MIIPVAKLTPGMQIIEDVITPRGSLVIKNGSILTTACINTLKKNGIINVQVAGKGSSGSVQVPGGTTPTPTSVKPVATAPGNKSSTPPIDNQTMPKVRINVERNGMSAYMQIEPVDGINCDLTAEYIHERLRVAGVIIGINELMVQEAVGKWNRLKQLYEFKDIATAIAPTLAKEGGIEVIVRHCQSSQELVVVQNSTHYWQLINAGVTLQRVDAGTLIAKVVVSIPAIPGHSVTGEMLQSDAVTQSQLQLNEYVVPSQDHRGYCSLITGVVFYINDTLGVLPMIFDGCAEVTLSDDHMSAMLTLHPAFEGGHPPSEKSIGELITKSGLTTGLNKAALSEAVQAMRRGLTQSTVYTIAQGVLPKNGTDGFVKCLFDTTTSLKPKEDEHGNVDYRDVNIIHSVKKGDSLAELIPPTKGIPGKDCCGKPIPARDGQPATLPKGPNTAIKENNPSLLVAITDGNVRLNGHVVEVYEGFIIKGDVDFSTGNINYEKSVAVCGDVKAGFTVSTGGDVEINGAIEDAQLHISGNLLCRRGFIGQGKGIIECAADVNIGFIKNQTVKSRGNINIAKESINAHLYSAKSIIINGKNLSIAGGKLLAKDSITAQVVGNMSEIQTMLEVGYDYLLITELEQLEAQINDTIATKGKTMDTIRRNEKLMSGRRRVTPAETEQQKKLWQTVEQSDQKVKAFEEQKKKLIATMHECGHAFIKIERSAMPGSIFKIADRHLAIKEEIIGPKTIRLINFEIVVL
ncbi:MAG: DUF342 domain-containing protein [Chitinivibrionales bacterium]|nr:DUF342 domain-containing protein [Chitinivibrionales bacterium]